MLQPSSPARSNPPRQLSTSGIEGLWVLLVANDGELRSEDPAAQVPVMARAGNDQTYLLLFKNVVTARQFAAAQQLDGANPRMVVRGNRDEIVRIARAAGSTGTLLDYDPASQKYAQVGTLD